MNALPTPDPSPAKRSRTAPPRLPQNIQPSAAAEPPDQAPAGCCTVEVQASCCEPAEKATCCGTPGLSSCGCQV